MGEIKVTIDALTGDAAKLDNVAEVIGKARTAASGLWIWPLTFSFAAQAAGEKYEELRQYTVTLLAEGESEISGAADALRAVAVLYSDNEDKARADLGKIWSPETA